MRLHVVFWVWLLAEGALQTTKVTQLTDKPLADSRLYQFAELPNGIQVLNIQEEKTTQAAIAVSVRAGSMFEPKDLHGLAHFCEHMLFLGTRKFPDPTGFDTFLGEAGGGSNAYTDQETTVYYANFDSRVFNDAVDRFADFFAEPLFNRQFVEKEVHAIDSEHQKNLQSPARRVLQVLNYLANPESRVNSFATGNYETLIAEPKEQGRDIVDALRNYFERSHCPQHLRVVTVAPEPVEDQLQKVQHSFSTVRGSAPCFNQTFAEPPAWPPEQLSKFVVVEPSEARPALWLQFALPNLQKEFASKPLSYISYVIKYAGVASLQNSLKKEGLIQDLSSADSSTSAGTRFFVAMYLTTKGAKNMGHVMDLFFQYIAKMKHFGVNSDLYSSLADLSRFQFNWTQPDAPGEAAKDYAERMLRLPPSRLISGDTRIDHMDAKLVQNLLDLFTPQNLILAYIPSTKTNATFPEGSQVFNDKYMKLEYAVMPLQKRMPDAVKKWTSWLSYGPPSEGPKLPSAIKHIPKALDTSNMAAATPVHMAVSSPEAVASRVFGASPALLGNVSTDRLRVRSQKVWYRSGWKTTSPKVSIDVALRRYRAAHELEARAEDQLQLLIFERLFIRQITPLLADLTTTDQTVTISLDEGGLQLSFEAFAPVLPSLIEKFGVLFNSFHLNASQGLAPEFNWTKQELLDTYSAHPDLPAKYAVQAGKVLLTGDALSREESAAGLAQANPAAVMRSLGLLILSKPLALDALVMGNIDGKTAHRAVGQLIQSIEVPEWASPAPDEQRSLPGAPPIALPAQPVEVRARNPRHGDPNDVALVKILVGVATVESRAAFAAIGLILGNLMYSQLRTEEQLGYVVQGAVGSMSNVLYVAGLVQGTSRSADEMEAAIEGVFWDSLPKHLKNLTDADVDSYRKALVQQYLQPPSSIDEERKHFFGPVKHHGACFDLVGEVVRFANSSDFNKDLLVRSWSELMAPNRGWRWKVAVKYFGKGVPERPDSTATRLALQKRGVPEGALSQLVQEHEKTMLLKSADSAARMAISRGSAGGSEYFPTDLHCRRASPDRRSASFLARRTRRVAA
ncbi:unnamed protein product [Symbiodinium natans]|uniref:Insulin-degrading enzyme n=1 Tax=Symbiodinium natans TaxID=878477 RepID=A0A812SAM4_9DINO|nr:unnamed protein product [Symbiodinium natans]